MLWVLYCVLLRLQCDILAFTQYKLATSLRLLYVLGDLSASLATVRTQQYPRQTDVFTAVFLGHGRISKDAIWSSLERTKNGRPYDESVVYAHNKR
ncbi:hypothetical protein DPMN_100468 [Dreissena polymorpha]|uniref:Secreted protein n=1 Tax=Dreissena polymorpha TaxID=45954 RepID=A0A9D4LHL6_DREPO|nr:hypothetical protein DPMN_100468 [Dreissena polymorpha]